MSNMREDRERMIAIRAVEKSIAARAHSDEMKLIRKLCEFLVTELREDNDTVTLDRLQVNQGKIEAYNSLIRLLEVVSPKSV